MGTLAFNSAPIFGVAALGCVLVMLFLVAFSAIPKTRFSWLATIFATVVAGSSLGVLIVTAFRLAFWGWGWGWG